MKKIYCKIKDVCEIKGGFAFKGDDFISNGIPIIRIGDIVDNKVDISLKTVYIEEKLLSKYEKFIIRKGDILVALSGATTGKYGIYDNDKIALLNQRVGKIVPTEKLSNKYMYYYMNKLQDIILTNAMGAAQPNISPSDIEELPIYVPSLKQQVIISKTLDRAQSLIDKRKSQIEALDELVKSGFIEMFGDPVINSKGWDIKDLGKLGYFKNGMNYKQSDSGFNIKFLGVGEFKYGNIINSSNMLTTLELQGEPNEEYLLKKGDIVFVRSNGSKELVGRSILVRKLEEKTTYSGFCIRYRNQCEDVTPDFLIQLFADKNFKKLFKNDSRGANINNLNQQMLSSLKIIVPPKELQNQFVDFLKQVDKLKFEMQESLTQLGKNFNSLIQKAFKGELFS